MLRAYALSVGVVFALFSVVEVVGAVKAPNWGDVLGYSFSAAAFFFAGVSRWGAQENRAFVGGMGWLLLLTGGVAGGALVASGASWYDSALTASLVRAGLGALSLFCAWLLPCREG